MYSPNDYKTGVEDAFKDSSINANIIDIFVIPDYHSFIFSSVDGHLSHLHTLDFTQLQWVFEYIPACRLFPFSVKTTYRRHSADRVCEIKELNKDQCCTVIGKATGLEPFAVPTITYPTKDTFPERGVEGFYLLTSIPCTGATPWIPAPFDENTEKTFDKIARGIYNFFPVNSDARSDWDTWLKNEAPHSNDVSEYLKTHKMNKPLEQYFNLTNPPYCASWLNGISQIDRSEPDNELVASDWEFPNMSLAIPQPSVHSRFNTNPPDPLLYFNNDSNHLSKFVQDSRGYYSIVLSKYTVSTISDLLRLIIF